MKLAFTIAVFVAIAVFIGYATLAVYHGLKFRYVSDRTKRATSIFVIVSSVTIIAAVTHFFATM